MAKYIVTIVTIEDDSIVSVMPTTYLCKMEADMACLDIVCADEFDRAHLTARFEAMCSEKFN